MNMVHRLSDNNVLNTYHRLWKAFLVCTFITMVSIDFARAADNTLTPEQQKRSDEAAVQKAEAEAKSSQAAAVKAEAEARSSVATADTAETTAKLANEKAKTELEKSQLENIASAAGTFPKGAAKGTVVKTDIDLSHIPQYQASQQLIAQAAAIGADLSSGFAKKKILLASEMEIQGMLYQADNVLADLDKFDKDMRQAAKDLKTEIDNASSKESEAAPQSAVLTAATVGAFATAVTNIASLFQFDFLVGNNTINADTEILYGAVVTNNSTVTFLLPSLKLPTAKSPLQAKLPILAEAGTKLSNVINETKTLTKTQQKKISSEVAIATEIRKLADDYVKALFAVPEGGKTSRFVLVSQALALQENNPDYVLVLRVVSAGASTYIKQGNLIFNPKGNSYYTAILSGQLIDGNGVLVRAWNKPVDGTQKLNLVP